MPRKNQRDLPARFASAEDAPRIVARRPERPSSAGHRNQVRIIGGEWRGRKLRFPATSALRPTPDRVRETLFNWLRPHVAGSRCLDLFAGSGALGFEALSRGARAAVFVETDPQAARQVTEMLGILKCDRASVVRMEAEAYLAQPPTPFDIVFLDPPFSARVLPRVCTSLEAGGWLKPGAHIYLEDAAAAGPPELPPGWHLTRTKRAGEVGYYLARRE